MISFFEIQFSLSILFSFLIGLGGGITIAALVYIIIVLATTRQKPFIVQTKANNVTDEEVKQMIYEAQQQEIYTLHSRLRSIQSSFVIIQILVSLFLLPFRKQLLVMR